jgi:hypothetical protein
MEVKLATRLLAPAAAAALLCAVQAQLAAQPGCAAVTRPRTTVEVDLATQQWKGALPYDEVFNLQVAIPELTSKSQTPSAIKLVFGTSQEVDTTDPDGTVHGRFVRSVLGGDSIPLNRGIQNKAAVFAIAPLPPNRSYIFDFVLYRDSIVERGPTRRDTLKVQIDSLRLAQAPHPDLTNHFDLDAGAVRSNRLQYTGVVMNFHYYAVPINNNECPENYRGRNRLLKRVSVFAGMSVLKIHSVENVEPLFASGTPVVGIGLARLPGLGPVRIDGGYVFVKRKDANPLVDRKHTRADPFVGLTVDFQLRKVLGPLAGLVGLGGG